MRTVLIILIVIMLSGIVYYGIITIPFRYLIQYIIDPDYRFFCSTKEFYVRGQRATPKNSYAFFNEQSIRLLKKSRSWKDHGQDIIKMLGQEAFIRHYFDKEGALDWPVFLMMWDDYRSGEYLHYEKNGEKEKYFPAVFYSTPGLLEDFLKLTKGKHPYFDQTTGQLLPDTQRQFAGRVARILGKERYELNSYTETFAQLWGVGKETVRDWARENDDPQKTKEIDDIILSILDS